MLWLLLIDDRGLGAVVVRQVADQLADLLEAVEFAVREEVGIAGCFGLDTRAARVLVAGQPLTLTSHEFKLLAQLMQRKGEVLSRTELAEHLYPQDSERDSNTIEVFVGRLRKKLPAGSIETVRGLGYRLVPAPAESLP